jgi:hypothetical protein
MFQWIVSFLSAPVLNSMVAGWQKWLDHKDTSNRVAADLAIKDAEAQIAARQEATKLLIVEQGHWSTRIIRPLFAWPFIIFLWKAIVWDKILAPYVTGTTGMTEPLAGDISTWASVVVVSYFGVTSVETVSRTIARILGK